MRRTALLWLAAALLATAMARDGWNDWVDATRIVLPATALSPVLRDRHGALLHVGLTPGGTLRLPTAPGTVDPLYLSMLTAWEDRRFARHGGVDGIALLRAATQAARTGRIVSGGSTLTMQVARLLEDGPTGTLRGKLRQMRVAWALERRMDKPAILSLYLTHAPFGGNIEGARAAALAWFGKEPHRLTPAQAALLTALPQSPETRRPDRGAQAARQARNRVLTRMETLGLLTPDAARAARAEPIPQARRPFPNDAPHLAARLASATETTVTLDATLQRALAPRAARAAHAAGAHVSAAILVADVKTGAIRASIGSAGIGEEAQARGGFIDMTRALRSPGSTLKPLVYALAFDAGLAHPATLIEDRPRSFGGYAPVNFDGRFRGELRVRDALQASLNLPVVALTEALGPPALMAAMRRAGMAPRLPGGAPGLAVSLGGVGLTAEDIARLYGALARGGTALPLHILGAGGAPHARVISHAAAWQVTDILSGLPPPAHGAPGRIAYKTGTSYGHRDAWAAGFDGAHVAVIWLGRPDGTPVPGAFGADSAAPLLFEVFDHLPATPLPPPPPEALILSTAELPLPLQRFSGPREAAAAPLLTLAFPPDGTTLARDATLGLPVKLRDGSPPFTWLANGTPVLTTARRDAALPDPGPGHHEITVIDAAGNAARTRIELH